VSVLRHQNNPGRSLTDTSFLRFWYWRSLLPGTTSLRPQTPEPTVYRRDKSNSTRVRTSVRGRGRGFIFD
jgi:hypothetical protein